MAPSTTWYAATLVHTIRSQNHTRPTALHEKVWDWALSSPPAREVAPRESTPFPLPVHTVCWPSGHPQLSNLPVTKTIPECPAMFCWGIWWFNTALADPRLLPRRGLMLPPQQSPCHLQRGSMSWWWDSHGPACAAVGVGSGSGGSLTLEQWGRAAAAICCETAPTGAKAGARRCWQTKLWVCTANPVSVPHCA